MSEIQFKYVPLTFMKDENQIKEQVKNTIIFRYLLDKFAKEDSLKKMIINTQYGYNDSAKESGKNKFLRISDITDGEVNWETVPYCDCKDEETYLLKKGDLLVARTGGTTGKSFLIDTPPSNAIYAGYLIRIRANKDYLPEYINLFLNSYAYWSQIASLNRGEFRPSVNATKLESLRLPKCSLEIQKDIINISKGISNNKYSDLEKRIEKALTYYDNCRNILNKINFQKEQIPSLRQSILQEAIQGKLSKEWRDKNTDIEPANQLLKRIKKEKAELVKEKKIKKEKPLPKITKEEIPFELLEGWSWCRLGEVSNKIHYGFTASANHNRDRVKFLRITDIQDNKVDWQNVPSCTYTENDINKYSLAENDIVIARTGGTIGKSFLIRNIPVLSLFASYLIRIVPNKNNSADFLKIFIDSPLYWKQLTDMAWGSGQPNVNATNLRKLILPLPPLMEQKIIVEKVEELLEKCRVLEEEVAKSKEYAGMLMQSVLKEVFEGE